VALASAGPYASCLHLALDRWSITHARISSLDFLLARYFSWRLFNSVRTAVYHVKWKKLQFAVLICTIKWCTLVLSLLI